MKKKLLLVTALFISSLLPLLAQNIIMVTDNIVSDSSYIQLLEDAGYTVDARQSHWKNLTVDSVAKTNALNAADLIFFTRKITSSGEYGDTPAEVAAWQSITTPIFLMADHIARSTRLQLLDNATLNGAVDTVMKVKEINHIVFTNMNLFGVDSLTKTLTHEKYQCTSATNAGNGTLIAIDPVHGWVTMAEWDSNTACYPGAGVQNGKRFWLGGVFTSSATTVEYRDLLLNIVEYMLTGTVAEKGASDIQLSNNTIREGEPVGTTIGILSATGDPQGDIASFALVAGFGDTDNGAFTLDGDTLRTDSIFDYDVSQSLSIRIRVTDSVSNVFEKALNIDVLSLTTPNDILLSSNTINEAEPIGTIVGILSAIDPQDDIASYALVAGTGDEDNSSFTIGNDTLRTNAVFNYEVKPSLSVRIQVTDSASNVFEKVLQINVISNAPTDINLSNANIFESEPIGTGVGKLSATDPKGDIAKFELVAGTGDDDNGDFEIVNIDSLVTKAVFNYDTEKSKTIRIQVTDSASNIYQKAFTILIKNKPPSVVDDQMANKPELYPNPALNYLMIKNVSNFEGSIISVTGQTVMIFKQSNSSLDISGLERGIYIITLTSQGEQYVYRFIKE